jgi:cytochrome c oxidase subunit 2
VAVYVWVIFVLLVAIARRRGAKNDSRTVPSEPTRERRILQVISGAIGATILILFAFLLIDLFTGQALAAMPNDPLKIKIIGHQWWWEVRYLHFPGEPNGGEPHGIFNAANEIHIPAGQPVLFELESQDVNHSFWVPALHGKKDLIPGQQASIWLQADKPGVSMGQCAEYCGEQHANMMLWIVAQSKGDFQQWVQQQRTSVSDPVQDRLKRGRAVFLGASCIICHTVQGTPAQGHIGPDLTHVAGRTRIAAGAIDFSRNNLALWITDPQSIKPGTKMPQNKLSADDLQALLDWMETLK